MTNKVINLRQFRKQSARQQQAQQADENAVKFGRSKAQKSMERTQLEKIRKDHAAHEREDDA
ncbi:DUF4169 family protein [Aliiroseovarius sp. PrR006]|uniref:DUF4169 family protein n=1 Tax=Aliiroseovarius sp. PrR006 TaxID=2706883 RepID=UPI0013D58206|nr:DUF4169 family protein [Aliiroseovarius sp. PrR006]NDW52511.1 DUF4169 family protein [Aliiroseovarius sp. PrR006]